MNQPHPFEDGHSPADDIAVIGMACRFPGANNYWEFWENLVRGRSSVREIPADRWNADAFYSPDPDAPNKGLSKWAGFIEDADRFDASFFRVSPREAELMDPQQRIMLELAWSCLEDAGYSGSRLKGSQTGVYIGVCNFDYKEALEKTVASIEAHLSTGTYGTLIPNRISYEFDFKGPSIPVDTACSSSLVALYEAVHALQRGECAQALVGGVSILCSPTYFIAFSKAGMLSPDGACMAFDHRANGYVRGEGAGLVLLKPLRRALEDQDHIWGVIKGTAINHGGKAASVTSPSAFAQSRVIVDAFLRAGVSPDSVGYIEAHGTGTPKGDPIEVLGMQRAFQTLAGIHGVELRERSCGIGSVKTNIGHLEAAAGIAGLVKVLLSMRQRTMPGQLHFDKLNPRIRLEGSPFYVVDKPQEWKAPAGDGLLRAGVSSFGFGGVNAHVVVEEYRAPAPAAVASVPQVFVLSARTQERLQARAREMLAYLDARDGAAPSLADLAYSLQLREPMEERAAFVTDSVAELQAKLARLAWSEAAPDGLLRGRVASGTEEVAHESRVSDPWEFARLWVSGQSVDWRALQASAVRARPVPLPPYPFERKRYWLLPVAGADTSREARNPLWAISPKWTERALPHVPAGTSPARASGLLCLTLLDAASEAGMRDLPDIPSIPLPVPEEPHGGQSWIDACWKSLNAVQDAVTRHRSSSLVLLSNSVPEYAATLFAMLQGIQKELELPAHWYAWEPEGRDEASLLLSVLADVAMRLDRPGARRLRGEGEARVCEERSWSFGPFPPRVPRATWARQGVFWIPGGNGGIGRKIAEHLASEYDATVILSGRSSEGMAGRARSPGGSRGYTEYQQADCTKRRDLERLLSWILDKYGRLTGVIHSAGVLRDRSIYAKTREDVGEVMAPKIEGALLLDEVTRSCALECFVLFSSLTGLWGNPGQTDYAAANAFLGQFARQRQERVRRGERSGTSMVIHWPYWEAGGMQLPGKLVERLEESFGMRPLKDGDGLAIFDQVLATRAEESAFTSGDLDVIERALGRIFPSPGAPRRAALAPEPAAPPASGEDVREGVTKLLATLTGSTPDSLGADAHFVDLGVDSILLQQLVRRVNEAYGVKLGILDLHNHPSIAELSEFIIGRGGGGGGQRQPGARGVPVPTVAPASAAPVQDGASLEGAVAIVGLDLQVPEAESLEEFWQLLGAVPRVPDAYPEERWMLLPPAVIGSMRREDCSGFFLKNALTFDHRLFGISPREAMLMDPQQRLVLQSVWRAIENSGYAKAEFASRRTAVFLSLDAIDYEHLVTHDAVIDEFTSTGVSRYIAANRISHLFNLRGLSEPVNTACSSFFVGLSRAIEAMRSGMAEQAVVAAVQANLLPMRFRLLRERGLLSRAGVTLPFDQNGDGFVRSEGVGAMVVKPLARALQDGDHIHAVIRGAGVWHAGMAMGVTAPNSLAHREAMKQALERAAVPIDSIGYVEAHGTGMPLGDASELDAIEQVFRDLGRDPAKKCVLGAAKAALGHLEAASGVAALTKVILALQKGRVPGLTHLQHVHSRFNPGGALHIGVSEQPLPTGADGTPVRAGLLSYGLGGVSAFLVLEAYRNGATPEPVSDETQPGLFVLSAQSHGVLEAYLKKILRFLSEARERGQSLHFGRFIETYRSRREPMACRVAVVARNFTELTSKLGALLRGEAVEGTYSSESSARGSRPEPALLARWVQERELDRLAEAHVAGADIPWPPAAHAREPLPNYPFNTERRFWISQKQEAR